MKLIIEITTRDDKTIVHECSDFPYIGSDFVTLYKKGFVKQSIRTETIKEIKQFFQNQK